MEDKDPHRPFTIAEQLQILETIDEKIVSLPATAAQALSAIATPFSKTRKQHSSRAAPENDENVNMETMRDGSNSFDPSSFEQPRNVADREAQFSKSMERFLEDLHTVNVLIKRQLWALDEANIITLPKPQLGTGDESQQLLSQPNSSLPLTATSSQPYSSNEMGTASTTAQQRLGPDGRGMIGKLDVGMLNSQTGTVEEELDRELWQKMRDNLKAQLEKERDDTKMDI